MQDLVTTSAFRHKTGSLPWPVLELYQSYGALSFQHAGRPQIRVDPASLCYITYTLGATVQPKGVAVSHANIVNFLRAATPIYAVTRNDRVYQGMSTAFDFSFEEIWPAWIAGATLVAGPPDHQRSGHRFTGFLIDQKITVLCCVPTQLAAIERDVPSLRCLIIGGEPCPPYLVSRWSRSGRRMPIRTALLRRRSWRLAVNCSPVAQSPSASHCQRILSIFWTSSSARLKMGRAGRSASVYRRRCRLSQSSRPYR